MKKNLVKTISYITMFLMIGIAINTANAEVIPSYNITYSESSRMIEGTIKLSVSGNEASDVNVGIQQSDDTEAMLDYKKEFFETNIGPIGGPPEVRKTGPFDMVIPLFKNGQYVSFKFRASNIKCGDINAGNLVITYKDSVRGIMPPEEIQLRVNIPESMCGNDHGWLYTALFWIAIIGIVVLGIYLKVRSDRLRLLESEAKMRGKRREEEKK